MRPTVIASNLFYMSAWEINHDVCVVIPAYKAQREIIGVLEQIPDIVSRIIIVDDGCPNNTGKLVQEKSKDKRVEVIFNNENLGVGGAMIAGYRKALEQNHQIIVKLDGDGQMDPSRIPKLIGPIIRGQADYSKGNRFDSLEDLEQMPKIRIFGNAVLSIMSKASSGYWQITDPTNGFTAIHRVVLERIHLGKLRKGWFFESDMLFRLAIIKAVVVDVPMPASYGSEKSNLNIRKVIFEFPTRHGINHFKRIFYLYYLREWSAASFEFPAGLLLAVGGLLAGINFWMRGIETGMPATVGQVMLSAVPLILGVQLILAFVSSDISSEPTRPRQLDY